MKRVWLAAAVTCLFTGCTVTEEKENKESMSSQSGDAHRNVLLLGGNSSPQYQNTWQINEQKRSNKNKNINDYARGIMQDLISNLQYVNASTPIAVADFVYLSSDFNHSDLLGEQLSEAFSHEVHKLGIPVVDYKLTGFIRVTNSGSFALSRDFLELEGDIPIHYILTGTLVEDRGNTIVNARIVGVHSKAIVASAQGILPKEVTLSLSVNDLSDGIYY